MKTFDNGNLNVSVIEANDRPDADGHWTAETYLGNGVWRWMRVNGESAAMRAFRLAGN